MNTVPSFARRQLRSLLLRAVRIVILPISSAPTRTSNILVIRPDHLGDVLFLTPALHALRRAQPNARITALVGPWAKSILANNPDVDHVETLAFPWFDRKPKRGVLDPYQRLYAAASVLRGRYDTALVCRFDHWWGAWLAAAAGIPRRIGYNTPDVRPFLTEAVPYAPGQHEVLQNFGLTRRLGTPATVMPPDAPLRFPVTEEERAAAHHLLESCGMREGTGPLVAIHPGSGAMVKRWRTEQWARLAEVLHVRHGARFVITGGPDEVALAAEVANRVRERVPVASVAGQTSLGELVALFEQCALAIGADSGPLHLAVAAGCRTVHLYGPVTPQSFGPWGDPARNVVVHQHLACQFCNRLDWTEAQLPEHPCVTHIPFSMAEAAAERLLSNL